MTNTKRMETALVYP